MRILILAILSTMLLASCNNMVAPEQPIVTVDSIEPSTTADEVVEAIQSELDQPYFWIGDDVDASLKQLNDKTIHPAYLDMQPEELVNLIDKENTIIPIITAQEAANISAGILKESYGIELNMLSIVLSEYRGVWIITNQDFSDPGPLIYINYTTGVVELIDCAQEIPDGMPVNEAYTVTSTDEHGFITGNWDETHPNYDKLSEELKGELLTQLNGSLLLNGKNILTLKLREHTGNGNIYEMNGTFTFDVVLEDGRMLEIFASNERAIYEYDFDGYPLRGYYIRSADLATLGQ